MKKLLTLAILFSTISSASFANGPKSKVGSELFYIGGSIGQSSVDTGISAGTATLDEDDTAFKIYGGVQLNKYLGAEAFYANLGEATISGTTGSTFTSKGTTYIFNQNADITFGAQSLGLAGTLGYKMGAIRPFVKAGIQRWNFEANYASGTTNANASTSGFDGLLGLGAELTILGGLNVRTEYEKYQIGNYDVDMLSAGINYRF